jgi:hypothetical protein
MTIDGDDVGRPSRCSRSLGASRPRRPRAAPRVPPRPLPPLRPAPRPPRPPRRARPRCSGGRRSINFTVSANAQQLRAGAQQLTPTARSTCRSRCGRASRCRACSRCARASTSSYEFTNADTTSTTQRARFGDMNVDLWITGIPAVAAGQVLGRAAAQFPVSPRAARRRRSSRRGWSFRPPWASSTCWAATSHDRQGSYTHNFNQYTTPGTPHGVQPQRASAAELLEPALRGVATRQRAELGRSSSRRAWGHSPPACFFSHAATSSRIRAAQPRGAVERGRGALARAQNTIFAAWVDWIATPWFTLEVGYSGVPQPAPGRRHLRQPLLRPAPGHALLPPDGVLARQDLRGASGRSARRRRRDPYRATPRPRPRVGIAMF